HPGDGVTVMSSISGAGDVNGDGIADLLVELRQGQEPFVFLIHGSPGRLPLEFSLADANATFAGKHDGFHLGFGSAAVGDINGDGYAELMLKSYADAGRTRLAVFYGGDEAVSGAMSLADADAYLEMPPVWMAIVPLGDLDEDGNDDLALVSETR